MTMFLEDPHGKVSGCTIDHTQTTEHDSAQGRVCPTTTSVLANLCRYVGATSLRLSHAPTREANVEQTEYFCATCIGDEANGLAPYL